MSIIERLAALETNLDALQTASATEIQQLKQRVTHLEDELGVSNPVEEPPPANPIQVFRSR